VCVVFEAFLGCLALSAFFVVDCVLFQQVPWGAKKKLVISLEHTTQLRDRGCRQHECGGELLWVQLKPPVQHGRPGCVSAERGLSGRTTTAFSPQGSSHSGLGCVFVSENQIGPELSKARRRRRGRRRAEKELVLSSSGCFAVFLGVPPNFFQ
jgi:hypothetical protein